MLDHRECEYFIYILLKFVPGVYVTPVMFFISFLCEVFNIQIIIQTRRTLQFIGQHCNVQTW